ncbi:MAG TPA: 5-(carboxyamino)imidazole ribonucleotide mutase [Armatimonadota bacterium]|nr:5-(carboxyamino)imidazole ribonucleotide mutase [Armatimonadota bacterium]
MAKEANALVLIVMGSDSDLPVVKPAAEALESLGIPYEMHVTSAHRTPERAAALAREARGRGVKAIIAAAGGAAHLAGALAAHTTLPVIGVPIAAPSGTLGGMEALLATAQMPSGVPVATVAINGARNAGLLAAEILATSDPEVEKKLTAMRKDMADQVQAADAKVREGRS